MIKVKLKLGVSMSKILFGFAGLSVAVGAFHYLSSKKNKQENDKQVASDTKSKIHQEVKENIKIVKRFAKTNRNSVSSQIYRSRDICRERQAKPNTNDLYATGYNEVLSSSCVQNTKQSRLSLLNKSNLVSETISGTRKKVVSKELNALVAETVIQGKYFYVETLPKSILTCSQNSDNVVTTNQSLETNRRQSILCKAEKEQLFGKLNKKVKRVRFEISSKYDAKEDCFESLNFVQSILEGLKTEFSGSESDTENFQDEALTYEKLRIKHIDEVENLFIKKMYQIEKYHMQKKSEYSSSVTNEVSGYLISFYIDVEKIMKIFECLFSDLRRAFESDLIEDETVETLKKNLDMNSNKLVETLDNMLDMIGWMQLIDENNNERKKIIKDTSDFVRCFVEEYKDKAQKCISYF